jgi:putative endonuclease
LRAPQDVDARVKPAHDSEFVVRPPKRNYCRPDPSLWRPPLTTSLPGLTRQSMMLFHMSDYWVYLLTNKPRSTLYVGITNDLVRRVYEHREGLVKGFTPRYGLKMLVYFEHHNSPSAAIQREKNIKHWSRLWKLQLVESFNPKWRDLYDDITR